MKTRIYAAPAVKGLMHRDKNDYSRAERCKGSKEIPVFLFIYIFT